MRAIPMMAPPPGPGATADQKADWCMQMLQAIVQASQDDHETIADAYQVSRGFGQSDVPVRVLNVDTATASDIAAVLGTWIDDWQKRGPTRGTG